MRDYDSSQEDGPSWISRSPRNSSRQPNLVRTSRGTGSHVISIISYVYFQTPLCKRHDLQVQHARRASCASFKLILTADLASCWV